MGFPKESPVYCPRSRPRVDVATWISLVFSCSVTTLLLLLLLDSLQVLGLMVATSCMVATLLAQCFSKVDVSTTVSRHDFVVFIFFCVLSQDSFPCCTERRDFSFKSRPHLCSYCISSGRDFLFLVATLFVVFFLHKFRI